TREMPLGVGAEGAGPGKVRGSAALARSERPNRKSGDLPRGGSAALFAQERRPSASLRLERRRLSFSEGRGPKGGRMARRLKWLVASLAALSLPLAACSGG